MPGKKFYAIAVGRQPGIYGNWPAAQAQVQGFAGAKFKGFTTKDEAQDWLDNPATSRPSTEKRKSNSTTSTEDTSPKEGEVTIYTDGGARYNPGPGGYGIVLIYHGTRKEFSGGYRHTTNNRMELMGCIVALRELDKRNTAVTLYSDSSYVVNGISKGWAKNWRKNGWIKSDKQPALNPDLWSELLNLVEDLNITFKWVKGHAGHPMNERCDELVVAASRQDDLPVDEGYHG